MRLEELHLDGFGQFHQQTFGPISSPVTVFYGPNEAGKSTLLAFIRTIIFGFPTRSRDKYYPPLSGGRHGGRIRLSEDTGETHILERYVGPQGGTATLRSESGESTEATATLSRLTGNATPDLFKNVFGFSLDELQNEGLMNDEGIANRIYSVGLGVSNLSSFTQSLNARKRSLFLPSGQKPEIARTLQDLTKVEEQLQGIQDNAETYSNLTAHRSRIDLELENAVAELSQLNARRTEIDNLLKGWEDWLELVDCERQLQEMPLFEQFPEDPVLRLERLEERGLQARQAVEDADEQLRQAGEAASVIIPGESLLEHQDKVETIRRGRSSFDNSVRDLPERRAELRGMEENLGKQLRDLGQEWDESRLDKFDASIGMRQEVEGWKEILAQRRDTVRRAEQRLEQEEATLTELRTAAREAEDRLPSEPPTLDAAGLREQRSALLSARGRRTEYELARQNYENLRGQLNSLAASQESTSPEGRVSHWLTALLAGVAIVLVIAGIVLGDTALAMGFIGGITLLAAAAYLLVRNRSTPPKSANPVAGVLARQSSEAEKSAESAWQLLIDAAMPLAIDGEPTSAALDDAQEKLAFAEEGLGAWRNSTERVEEVQRLLKSQEQKKEEAARQSETAASADSEARQDWQGILEQKGLPTSFMPETVVEFMSRVEATRAILQQARQMRARVKAIEHDIDEYLQLVEPVATEHGLSWNTGDPSEAARVADELIAGLEHAQSGLANREQAEKRQEENRRLLEQQKERAKSVQEAMEALLAAGGACNQEEFRERARQHRERTELEQKRAEHLRGLERISGPDERLQAFRKSLSNTDPVGLNEESVRLSEQLEALETRRGELREERGGIEIELARLSGEEESSALRVRRNSLEERLREQAREWSRLTIAEALLEKTREKFELERQPSVVQHAEGFFFRVTGGRYTRVFAPIGEQTITVTDVNGSSKQPNELSRGTREQLYLALRFGLIREFGEHAERLPVVVDEALVNFDPKRSRLAAQSFAELAKTNQVLVFTCHPATAEMFADVADADLVDIGSLSASG